MRHITRAAWSTAAVLALTGCGSQIASSGTTPEPTSRSSPTETTGSSTGAGGASLFPVTLTRTGGVAGFNDVLVVSADGLVSITRKGQVRRQCRLTHPAVLALTAGASEVAWPRITPGSSAPTLADDLVTMVRSRTGGPVRLQDDQIGTAGKVFQDLIDNLLNGGDDPGICVPV